MNFVATHNVARVNAVVIGHAREVRHAALIALFVSAKLGATNGNDFRPLGWRQPLAGHDAVIEATDGFRHTAGVLETTLQANS